MKHISQQNKQPNAQNKPINYVHRHGMTFNKAVVHTDKKKAAKRGYTKHKQGY